MVTVATITRRNIGIVLKREPMATHWLVLSALEIESLVINLQLEGIPCSLVGQVGEVFRHCTFFELRLGLDLEELELDELMISRKTT